jgi:dienelactone hydrolase
MAAADALHGYEKFEFNDGRWTRPVYRRGSGPAVIIIHEMPGMHPLVIRFADHVAAAGMTAVMPSLFGSPGREVTMGHAVGVMLKAICVRREFNVWATNRSSPIVDWCRALARKMHAECGGNGVGAVGMCFTGNFALAMMTEPSVVAPVLSQPSLPLPSGPGSDKRRGAIGVSDDEIACAKRRFKDENLSMIGLRFFGDSFVPDERFDTLKKTFGDKFEAIELDPKDAAPNTGMAPHSVLTLHLVDDDPAGPTKRAEQRVIEFFRQRVGAIS